MQWSRSRGEEEEEEVCSRQPCSPLQSQQQADMASAQTSLPSPTSSSSEVQVVEVGTAAAVGGEEDDDAPRYSM